METSDRPEISNNQLLSFAGIQYNHVRCRRKIWIIKTHPLVESYRMRIKATHLPNTIEIGLTPISNIRQATVKAEALLFASPLPLVLLPSFAMKILVWNTKGTANDNFKNYFKHMVNEHQPAMVALCETKVPFEIMGNFFTNLGFSSSILSDPQGFAGGIWILWKQTEVEIQHVATTSQVIHVIVRQQNYNQWLFSTVYGNPHNRTPLWDNMATVADNFQTPWMAAGDFNDNASPSEKRSTTNTLEFGRCRRFRENLNRCSLMDLGASGPSLTWDNGRKGLANTQIRLDRAVANPNWRTSFPEATVTNLPRIHSDHSPLIINIQEKVRQRKWVGLKASVKGPPISHLFFADDLMLCAKTNNKNINAINNVLNDFSNASGLQINLAKSKLFVSPNLHGRRARDISHKLGIALTDKLGRYLGVNIWHDRFSKNYYHDVVEKVQNRLAGWKAKLLSMARRAVLTKSVLSSIPIYSMQTAPLPSSTCNTLDKINRGFLWGDMPDRRKTHWINWNKVCEPKGLGGLGIRKAKANNLALLSKLAWAIAKQPCKLWVQVLTNKYCLNTKPCEWVSKRGQSPLWKGILLCKDVITQNTKWIIGEGTSVNFWLDWWVGDGPLSPHYQPTTSDMRVADVIKDGCWDIRTLNTLLNPEHIREVLLTPISSSNKPDNPSWSLNIEGFVKLNTDGAACGNPGPSGYGGILRDGKGNFKMSYKGYMGKYGSAYPAELEASSKDSY